MKYRSRTEIIALILEAANVGVTKTKMMYSAYLSYAQVTEYIAFLSEKGLLKFDATKGTYTLTEKGLQVRRACDEINEMVNLDTPAPVNKETVFA